MKEKIRKTLRLLIIAFGAITLLLPMFLINDTDPPLWLGTWAALGIIIWIVVAVFLLFAIVALITYIVSQVINWAFGAESDIDDWFD